MTVIGMLASGLHYFPVTLPFLLALMGLLGSWSAWRPAGAALRLDQHGHRRTNCSQSQPVALGSYINIPVAYLPNGRPPPPPRSVTSASRSNSDGPHFAATVLAVNVGGALIPSALSL